MNVKQIESSLKKIGNYSLNSWIPFNEVSIIILDQDGRFFPNKEQYRLNFSSNGVVKIVEGALDPVSGIFKDFDGIDVDSNYNGVPTGFIDYEKIWGFVRSVDILPGGIYQAKTVRI